MQIAFETEAIRETCLKADVAQAKFGNVSAKSLFSAIADIRAASTAIDLFLAEETEDENGSHKLQVKFQGGGQLTLVSNHNRHNGPNAVRVNWSQVTRIRILEISLDAR